ASREEGKKTTGLPTLAGLVDERVAKRAAEWLGLVTVDAYGFARRAATQESAGEIITQDSVADLFAERHTGGLRYCHSTGAWFKWTGSHWQKDEVHVAFQFARKLGREQTEGGSNRDLREVRKVAFAGGVEKFAQSDERLAVTVDHWDRDPFLLG